MTFPGEVYRKGDHFVVEETPERDSKGRRYTVCDQEDCSSDLYHTGDSYVQLEHAINMANFWEAGNHWADRPDMGWEKV